VASITSLPRSKAPTGARPVFRIYLCVFPSGSIWILECLLWEFREPVRVEELIIVLQTAVHLQSQAIGIQPFDEHAESLGSGRFQRVCLGLSFDEGAVEGRLENGRFETGGLLVDREVLVSFPASDLEGDEFIRFPGNCQLGMRSLGCLCLREFCNFGDSFPPFQRPLGWSVLRTR
jgi:hypothetical protein